MPSGKLKGEKTNKAHVPSRCLAGPRQNCISGEDIRRKVNQDNLIGNRDSVTQRRDIVLCPYTLFTVGFYEL